MSLCLALMCVPCLGQGTAAGLEGSWSGTLSLNGTELELVFHLGENCTVDVPAQGAEGIEAAVSCEPGNPEVKIDIPSIGARFEGMYVYNMIAGTFCQSGMEFPLTLVNRGPRVPSRPQTPVPPFPYSVEEVSFVNGSAVLSGSLTVPEGSGMDSPAVVMVSGSGSQNRDEEIMGHKPFAVIADAFARAGIVTLRYDDRGFAASTGDVDNATTDTLAADAASGIAFLRGRGYRNVGVLGHSEGGTIAFMLAAEGLPDFIVSMAGGIEPGSQILFSQVRAQSLCAGASVEQAEAYAAQVLRDFRLQGGAWATRFLDLDPAEYVGRVHCRVLALNGEKDMQVLASGNIPLLQSLLPSAETKIYPGLNHLFQHCDTGLPSEYYGIEETISEEVLTDMTAWILER